MAPKAQFSKKPRLAAVVTSYKSIYIHSMLSTACWMAMAGTGPIIGLKWKLYPSMWISMEKEISLRRERIVIRG